MLKKARDKVVSLLKQGITPEKLALTAVLGICLGIIPLLGSTILLCTAAAFLLRLNLPAIQAVNYALYPVQLLLHIPFLKTGAKLFSEQKFDYSLSEIVKMLSDHLWETMSRFFWINMSALLLWLIVSAIIALPIYWICSRLFNKIASQLN